KGLLRLVEPLGDGPDRYEATPEGVEHFRSWLCRVDLPPTVRDSLQCKMEFLGPADLEALIRTVRAELQAYTSACDIAHSRLLREQRDRRRGTQPADWQTRLRGIQTKDEVNLWAMMSGRLERLARELEALRREVVAS